VTPRERMMTALSGGVPDRVPVFLRDLTLGLDVTDLDTPTVCAGPFDAELSARSVMAAQREIGHDAVVGSIQYCGMEVEMLGGEVMFPRRGIPSVTRAPFDSPERVYDAEVPDARRDAPLSNVVLSYRLVSERAGREVAVLGNVEGPLTKAGILRGLDIMALDMVSDPDVFLRTVRFSNELTIDLCSAMCEAGADAMFVAAATDNPDILGRDAIIDHTVPGLQRIVDTARSEGSPTVFHPHGTFSHGEFSDLVEPVLGTGVAGFQFAEGNDLAEAKARWGRRTCIMGGVNAFTTLLLGPLEAIREETTRCLDACMDGGGYVMMCSCSLHRGMPLDHVKEMVRACASLGHYKAGGGPSDRPRGGWAMCPSCGHRYGLIEGKGKACYGCPSAVRGCGMTRCPRCDAEAPIGRRASERLSSLLRRHRSQYGRPSFR
jgi:MtaA/CmuA family methyltransferase